MEYLIYKGKEDLLEKIYGNKAIVYHRTNADNLIRKFWDKGYKPKGKAFYGKGFYSTFNLEFQLDPTYEMKRKYGDLIVKFIIYSLYNFLFLTYEEFKKSPRYKEFLKKGANSENFINLQLKEKGIIMNIKPEEYSSDILKKIYPEIMEAFDGVIYNEKQGDNYLLCYNLKLIYPIEYSDDEGKTFHRIGKNLDCIKEVSIEANKRFYIDKREEMKIFKYIDQNNIKGIKKYIDKKRNLDIQNEEGLTPLVYAYRKKNKEVIKILAEAGVDINTKDEEGRTLLILSCKDGDVELVRLLIEIGGDIETSDEEGNTPLMYACWYENLDIVKELIRAGAKVNIKNKEGMTALMLACARENIGIIKILLEVGADVFVPSKWGGTILDIVKKTRNKVLIEMIEDAMGVKL